MACCRTQESEGTGNHQCACPYQWKGEQWLSKKKKVQALKDHLQLLEGKTEDIREYIKELEK